MDKPLLIAGNWKMHGDMALAQTLLPQVAAQARRSAARAKVLVCPPSVLLSRVQSLCEGVVSLGGQDCHAQAQGAFTGDISAQMLKEAGCGYVIVGHSERRQYHKESSEEVRAKAEAAVKAGITPIICIGETLEERESGQAEAVLARQLAGSLPESGHFVLAYEPVWAIGSGKTPSADDIARMHAFILGKAAAHTGGKESAIQVLYGGSVKGDNADVILGLPGVSGVLVGGASLKGDEFCRIIAAA